MFKNVIVFLCCGFVSLFGKTQTDTIRVTCVGNSITIGSNANDPVRDPYPAQLNALLGKGWIVKNCGVSGRTMLRHGDYPYWNEQFFKDALASNPDIVTISLGTNDTKPYNWDDHKAEFVPDYAAMIDTFRALPSHPEVWLCLPCPAFKVNYDIRDSIIVADIIPMIRQLAADKGCPIINFNTPMLGLTDLFPDGIHPNTEGYSVMAKILYETLTGKTISRVQDENVAAGKPVEAIGTTDPVQYGPGNLTDKNPATVWKASGFPSQAVVDLGSVQNVDLFGVHFSTEADAGYQYTIETAVEPGVWSAAVDHSARTDTNAVVLDKTAPLDVRYVKLTITGAAHPKGNDISVAELYVLKTLGSAHAPVMFSQLISLAKTFEYFYISINWPTGQDGAFMIYKKTGVDGIFAGFDGYQPGATFKISREVVKKETVNSYYTVAFLNGVEVASDTIAIDLRTTGVEENTAPKFPSGIALLPAYPNPFNPSTTLTFTLKEKSAVALRIYDAEGRLVTELVRGTFQPGAHRIVWDATDDSGKPMASGIYMVRLEAGNLRLNQKMVLTR